MANKDNLLNVTAIVLANLCVSHIMTSEVRPAPLAPRSCLPCEEDKLALGGCGPPADLLPLRACGACRTRRRRS